MFITKKRFNEIIKEAVQKAVDGVYEKVEEEKRLRSIEKRIDDLSSDTFGETCRLRDKVSDVEEAIWNKINEIECKISHKKRK